MHFFSSKLNIGPISNINGSVSNWGEDDDYIKMKFSGVGLDYSYLGFDARKKQ